VCWRNDFIFISYHNTSGWAITKKLYLRLWSHCNSIFCNCVHSYYHIVPLFSAFVFTLIIIVILMFALVFTLMITWWLYCQQLFHAHDHILSVLSAFIFTLMVTSWLNSQHLCLRLWSHNVCLVYICVYAHGHIETLLSVFVFTLMTTYLLCLYLIVFTLMIILRLYCQHLCLCLWSHSNSIVLICVYAYDHKCDCIVGICVYAYCRNVTVLLAFALTLINTYKRYCLHVFLLMIILWLYCQKLYIRLL